MVLGLCRWVERSHGPWWQARDIGRARGEEAAAARVAAAEARAAAAVEAAEARAAAAAEAEARHCDRVRLLPLACSPWRI